MKKNNVLFVIPTLRMGGAEKSLVSLLKALDPGRLDVDLFLFEAGGVLQQEIPAWVNIIEADKVTRAMTLELRNYFPDLLKSRKIGAAAARILISLGAKFNQRPRFSWDVIEKHIPKLPKAYDIAIGYLEGTPDFFVLDKVQAKRKIGWIHSDLSGRTFHSRERESYNRFDALVTISDVCRDGFVRMVPEVKDKIFILENIVIAEDILAKAGEIPSDLWDRDGTVHLVSVGRLDHHKGIDIAAKTAKILLDRGISVRWHVYGQGVMKTEIEQYIQSNNLQDIFFLEGLRKNPYPYIKHADILVQPSRLEGKSIVLDEAKILGKAIVVTNYPSVTDQITDRKTGCITKIDPSSIADGIEELMLNPELKRSLEENAAQETNRSYMTLYAFYKLLNI